MTHDRCSVASMFTTRAIVKKGPSKGKEGPRPTRLLGQGAHLAIRDSSFDNVFVQHLERLVFIKTCCARSARVLSRSHPRRSNRRTRDICEPAITHGQNRYDSLVVTKALQATMCVNVRSVSDGTHSETRLTCHEWIQTACHGSTWGLSFCC